MSLADVSNTRMVQLHATAAIEYVAACWPWVSGARGIFVRGCFCPGGLLPGDFCPGGLCPFPPSSMRIHTIGFLCLAS